MRNSKFSTTTILFRFCPSSAGPVLHLEVTFDEDLLPLGEILLSGVSLLAELAPVEDFDFEEARLVFPLASRLILLAGAG